MKKHIRFVAILICFLGVECLIAAGILAGKLFHDTSTQEKQIASMRPEESEVPESLPVSEESTLPEPSSQAVEASEADLDTPPEATSEQEPSLSETEVSETDASESEAESAESESEEPVESESEEPLPEENPYKDSFLANADMAGWLQIPGTPIDYPVMWTPADENYYLERGFDKKKNSNGCLILDTDSSIDPVTTNLIIHGHNMKSGAMFGTLTKYEKQKYCEEHNEIYLYTPECKKTYEVVAVFRSQVFKKSDQVFKYYKFFQAKNKAEFDDFYDNIKEMSLYDTGVTASFGDRFITLSTCTYHVEQGRFVVVAKETESGESYAPME